MSPRAALLAMVLALFSCRDDGTQRRREPEPSPDPACNDGKIDQGEDCDGSQLGGATCKSLGFDSGSLACGSDCKLVTAGCVRRCGNGSLEVGEECDGALGVAACASWGYRACAECKLDSSHCVTQAFQGAPALQQPYGGPAILADIAPKGMGDLIAAAPARIGLKTYPYTVVQGFVAGRSIGSTGVPVLPVAGDLDGDGEIDLASIHQDGSAARYLYAAAPNSFPAQSYPGADGGAGCPAFRWVGAGQLDPTAGLELVALGCPTGSLPFRGNAFLLFEGGGAAAPPRLLAEAGVVTAALGDANQDGLSDLLFVTDAAPELRVRLAPDFSGAASSGLPFSPEEIAAGDLDGDGDLDLLARTGGTLKALENTGASFAERYTAQSAAPVGAMVLDLDLDGRLDLAWISGDRAQLRRNAGSFQFTPYEGTTGTGAPLSLAAGDMDGDGDPDLAATYSQGGDATVTYVLINQVR
ncbi:MAG: VCBS repeat-containing protein [Myxococcales bacterium]|nr:VCBS repeat-containing protein [Myxococcales bacterium]